jgi:hypothetical protein
MNQDPFAEKLLVLAGHRHILEDGPETSGEDDSED